MDAKLQVGIVGCGGIAQVIHLPILSNHPDVRVAGICDIDASKAAVLADKFRINHIYQDIAELLQKEKLDVMFILTPTNLHLPMSLMALEYGAHIFIEKPATPTASEARRIQKKARETGKVVMVGMQNRFRSDVVALKKFLDNRDLGKLFYLKGSWLQAKHHSDRQAWFFQKNVSGGGVILDLGIQLLELVWWVLDRPNPINVRAFSFQLNKEIEVEDFCVVCLTFENEISFSMEVSWDFPIVKDRFSLEIIGEYGTGTLNPLKLQKSWHGQLVNITPGNIESKTSIFKKGYEKEINHFIDYLLGRIDKLDSTIDDAVEILRIVDGIYQSIDQGCEITLA